MSDCSVQVIRDVAELREQVSSWKRAGEKIAFVPTMGNLHAGHLSLVSAASKQAERTVVSIFVNPMQFSPDEDFSTYPRTFDDDLAQLEGYDVDIVFAPSVETIYPNGDVQTAQGQTSFVEVPGLSHIIEGEFRPDFFRGVATVVNKLFNMVQPDIAFFGEKDYQQLLVIKQMVKDLNLPIEIQSVATAREKNGLAMSSRNNYLNENQHEKGSLIYCYINKLRDDINTGKDCLLAQEEIKTELNEQGFEVDYLCVCDASTLEYVDDVAATTSPNQSLIILVAARLGKVRLIDNLLFKLNV